MGGTGAVDFWKSGFQNQMETSLIPKRKPRLVVTQSAGNYPADQYFYRQ